MKILVKPMTDEEVHTLFGKLLQAKALSQTEFPITIDELFYITELAVEAINIGHDAIMKIRKLETDAMLKRDATMCALQRVFNASKHYDAKVVPLNPIVRKMAEIADEEMVKLGYKSNLNDVG